MTKRSVMAGVVGSSPINFSATMTWAELETGNNSVAPWMMARIKIFDRLIIRKFTSDKLR